ncbi:hypothetical protein [Teichococcus deserti]|uniref:hypothetical protein n=1 Tax=Teichococcus deserti TaxID=1817963 RepID=UPI0010557704|nr:hypothetical protein [Pseudoroseomonas deserti]
MAGHHHLGRRRGNPFLQGGAAQVVALGVDQRDVMPGINQRTADAEQAEGDLVADAARGEREIGRVDQQDAHAAGSLGAFAEDVTG